RCDPTAKPFVVIRVIRVSAERFFGTSPRISGSTKQGTKSKSKKQKLEGANPTKRKNKIGGYILRSSAAALLFLCGVVALSSAINLSNHPPKFPTQQNNTDSGVNGRESASSVAAPSIPKNRTLTFADRVAY